MVTDKDSVRIDKKVLQAVRSYCQKNGLKYSWFIEKAIKNELKTKGIGIE